MITYKDLYEASRKERYSEDLQKLPQNFIKGVSQYFREKKELISKEEDGFSDAVVKSKKQLENARMFFKELVVRRRKKILNLVLIAAETGISKRDFENMFKFEKELFEEIMKCVDDSDKKLKEILNDKNNDKSFKNDLVVFNEDVDSFTGFDGESLGPFSKGQVANLPKKVVDVLVGDKKAEKIVE